jgi:diguanylate cyclase (GGDEF)-like protein/PAS domain S-box-containing protein
MNLRPSTRVVAAAWAAAGLAFAAAALQHTVSAVGLTDKVVAFAVVFGTLLAASWVWPIRRDIDGASDAIDLDEAFFVVLVLLIPAVVTVLVFAVAAIVAHAIRRRRLVQSAFEVGRVVASVGFGALVFALLRGPQAPPGYAEVGAALAGAVTYFVVSMGATVSIAATRGVSWRRTVFEGLRARLVVMGGGVSIAIPAGLLLAHHPRYLPLAVLPLLVLRSLSASALANADLYVEVRQEREKLAVITGTIGEGVCAVSEDGRITFMNPAGADMLGWFGLDVDDEGPGLPAEETPDFLRGPAQRAMALRRSVTSDDARFQRLDGSQFPVTVTASPVLGGASPSGAVIVFRDTSVRKALEEQLTRHAFEDALTGLANRRLLLDHLDHALLQAERTGSQVAVLFCDIDRFKVVNDYLGHRVGDELIRLIGERLRHAVRPGDMLSRFGGDEFVVLLEGVGAPDEATGVAHRVLDSFRDPFTLGGGHEVVATLSIGAALSDDGTSRDELLHHADIAMYRAKARGRGGQFALFDIDRMGARSVRRRDLDSALHHVLSRGELEIHYQPLVALADRRIVGAEALVRWNHPDHGILLPAQFIKVAEDNGTIVPIGALVLEQACRQAQTWQQEFGVRLQVGVNLSARQFQHADLDDEVAGVLQATGIDPTQLCLEITENLAMDDVDRTSRIVTGLHTLGVRVAIDDFGRGHSSLGSLARLPADVVKIDQAFVHAIDHDPVQSAIVSAVVALSRAIGATTVAEGVETLAQLQELATLGCDVAQGYYFARPVTAAAFSSMLTNSARSSPPPDLHIVLGERAG